MILIAIYNREGRYDQSLRFIDELLAKYPRNFQFEMDRAAVYGKMKNWPQAVGAYQQILSKVQTKQDGFDRLRATVRSVVSVSAFTELAGASPCFPGRTQISPPNPSCLACSTSPSI